MTDTQGTQTVERIDYRKEGVEMGVIVPTFSEFCEQRAIRLDPSDWFQATVRDYLDTYGPGSR